jgi:hypothetical protein
VHAVAGAAVSVAFATGPGRCGEAEGEANLLVGIVRTDAVCGEKGRLTTNVFHESESGAYGAGLRGCGLGEVKKERGCGRSLSSGGRGRSKRRAWEALVVGKGGADEDGREGRTGMTEGAVGNTGNADWGVWAKGGAQVLQQCFLKNIGGCFFVGGGGKISGEATERGLPESERVVTNRPMVVG